MKDARNRRLVIAIMLIAVVLITIGGTFAFFIIQPGRNEEEKFTVKTGSLAITFEDNDTGLVGRILLGETLHKEFKIINTGTESVTTNMIWHDLINTYLKESLTYKLEYKTSADSEDWIPIDTAYTNVPHCENPNDFNLAGNITIPSKKTYFYRLSITFNNLKDVNQEADRNATLNTKFIVGDTVTTTSTLVFNGNGGETTLSNKDIVYGNTYGDLPTPTKYGYDFTGWYTEENGGTQILSTNQVNTADGQTVYAHWNPKKFADVLIANSNPVNTQYNSTTAKKTEPFAISHEAVGDTSAQTDYRYIGNNPNNYIKIFNEDSPTWRILKVPGVEGDSIEIISDNFVSTTVLGNTKQMQYMDESYTKAEVTLSLLTENVNKALPQFSTTDYIRYTNQYTMEIDMAKNSLSVDGKTYYDAEQTRVSKIGLGTRYEWAKHHSACYKTDLDSFISASIGTSYLGFILPSDYIFTFANGVNASCYSDATSCSNPSSSWMYKNTNEWLAGGYNWSSDNWGGSECYNDIAAQVIMIKSDGKLTYSRCTNSYSLRAKAKLKNEIKYKSGDGSKENPYIVQL